MTDIVNDFGVQSYCFRTIETNADVAAAVKAIGLSKVEVCRKHCDFFDEAQHEPCIATYQNAGVAIQSIGVEMMTGDEAKDRSRFEFARKAGIKHLSVNFDPATFDDAHPVVQKLAEEYDVRCGIHNHGGYHWLGNMGALSYVFAKAGDRIGLCLDTAWALQAKQDPIEMTKKFGERLFAIHLKDFIFEAPTAQHVDVVVGTGNLDLPGLLAAAKEVGFSGEAILEYEGDPDNPVPTLKKCVEAIKAVD